MFSCEFYKIFKRLFFIEHLLLDFSIYFTVFATLWTNRNQSFSIFGHVFSQHSNVMNIMNLNDLVVAAWKHIFLGWYHMELSGVLYSYMCILNFCAPLPCNYSPMEHLKVRLNLKWNLRKQSSWGFVKKVFSNIYENSQENTCTGISPLLKKHARERPSTTLLKKETYELSIIF